MLNIAWYLRKKNNEFLSIVRPTKGVLDNLEKTGILKFVLIIDKTIQINAKEVEATKISNEELKKHILELHEILMNLNEENKKIFSNVVELMKKGLDKWKFVLFMLVFQQKEKYQ